jgi:hypothetical protein
MPPEPNNFSSFFLCFQRLGLWPRETKNLVRSLENGAAQAVVIINPDKPFSKTEKEVLKSYVRSGGVLVIADSVLSEISSLNDLLGSFGLSSRLGSRTFAISNEQTPSTVVFPVKMYYPTSVGQELSFKESDGFSNLVLVESKYRAGKIFIVTDSYMISNAAFGDPGNPPTQLQYDLHQQVFFLIERILGSTT